MLNKHKTQHSYFNIYKKKFVNHLKILS